MKNTPELRRPRLDGQRLTEVLDVAAEVFVELGFQGASTNLIAARAGASKASLYARFPSKEDLFVAVLKHRMDGIFEEVAGTISNNRPLRKALREFGKRLVQSGLSDAQIALIRIVGMETTRFPQLGRRFYQLGPERGRRSLAEYLEVQVKQGALRDADPHVMAEHFFGLVAGAALFSRLLGVRSHRSMMERSPRHIEQAVETFLRAYANS